MIKLLCNPENKFNIIERIINHLGTLGVRYHTIDRICVEREMDESSIELKGKKFPVRIKISYYITEGERRIVNVKPEYDDLQKIRRETGRTIKELTQILEPKLNTLIKKKKKIKEP